MKKSIFESSTLWEMIGACLQEGRDHFAVAIFNCILAILEFKQNSTLKYQHFICSITCCLHLLMLMPSRWYSSLGNKTPQNIQQWWSHRRPKHHLAEPRKCHGAQQALRVLPGESCTGSRHRALTAHNSLLKFLVRSWWVLQAGGKVQF